MFDNFSKLKYNQNSEEETFSTMTRFLFSLSTKIFLQCTICLFDDNYFAKVQYTSGMLVPGPLPGFGQIEGDAQNLRLG